MKKTITVLLCAFTGFYVYGQKAKTYIIQPGEPMQNVVPFSDANAYSQFQNGVVYFKNGTASSARLNYNFLFEEMLFIRPQGDTLTFDNSNEVHFIQIGKDTFYSAFNRFVRVDTVFGEIKIATATFYRAVSKGRVGAYGSPMLSGSDPYALLLAPTNNRLGLIPQVVTTISIGQSLFIGNKFNEFQPVNRKTVLAFYSEKEAAVKHYIQTHNTDFSIRKDVFALIEYMSKL
ncbi:hypothetical protein [Lacibacter sp.]|uniref:hypothetical protein n=1 Tax=Lacibacter sp. TaxID=1915409 RepID=UPI002B4B2F95|nr:hypothetical protein [Lacibacter sp.]HLP38618.1 hypothetical protein [Lacibacter sp.]